MTTLITILAVLFLSLIVVIPMVEKYTKKHGPIQTGNMHRYILPLMAVLLVLGVLRYYIG
jgi:hypothetical protein